MPNETFQVGDGVTFSINGDSYPGTVRKTTPKSVWVSEDDFRAQPGKNSLYQTSDKKGVFVPVDVDPTKWRRFTLRRDGTWRGVGTNYYFLNKGRRLRRDPSF